MLARAVRNGRFARRPAVVLSTGALLLVGLVVALGISFGLDIATFVVVVYSAVFAAVAVLGWRPFQPRPELTVSFWINGEMHTSVERRPGHPKPTIDIEACVRDQIRRLRESVPPPDPAPRPEPWYVSPSVLVPPPESYDSALTRFNQELAVYTADLRRWLEHYEARRWPNYSLIVGRLAVHNGGRTVADRITLRLRLPMSVTPVKDEMAASMPPPPEPPEFKRMSGWPQPDLSAIIPPSRFANAPPPQDALGTVMGPTYLKQGDVRIAQFRMEALTHGVTELSSGIVALIANEPGVHVIDWEAHVGNLTRSVRGHITIDVEAWPDSDDVLATLDAAIASGDVPIRQE
jgi:hypothetical protein